MSEDNNKNAAPPIPSVLFAGYKGGELVWNAVETRAAKEEGVILLDSKQWPFVRKLPLAYADFIKPYEVREGELYADVTLEGALRGLSAFYGKKIDKFMRLQKAVTALEEAIEVNDVESVKEARA